MTGKSNLVQYMARSLDIRQIRSHFFACRSRSSTDHWLTYRPIRGALKVFGVVTVEVVQGRPAVRNPRGIDGMLLTKYDTVDDKVGSTM